MGAAQRSTARPPGCSFSRFINDDKTTQTQTPATRRTAPEHAARRRPGRGAEGGCGPAGGLRRGSAARELPEQDGAVRGREEVAAGGGEAAEVDGVVVAGVVLRLAGGAAQQPQEPLWGGKRRLSPPRAAPCQQRRSRPPAGPCRRCRAAGGELRDRGQLPAEASGQFAAGSGERGDTAAPRGLSGCHRRSRRRQQALVPLRRLTAPRSSGSWAQRGPRSAAADVELSPLPGAAVRQGRMECCLPRHMPTATGARRPCPEKAAECPRAAGRSLLPPGCSSHSRRDEDSP